MKMILVLFTKYKFLLIAVLLAVLSVSSLFHLGLPPTHDGEYHVIRFYEFDKALRSGSLYPVWAQDLNYTYGVPLFNYIYPLPNYVASIFHVFTFSFIDGFKINLILATVVGAITSYFLGKQKFGVWGGLLTSVFYTYAPYHFLDIYIRGSVGEVWALAFFPLPLLFINRLIKKQTVQDAIFLSLSLAFIIFSHNILSLMYFGFLATYIFVFVVAGTRNVRGILYTTAGTIFSLFLTAVFILPAIFESRYVVGLNTFTVTDHFPDLVSLLIPSWGSGYSGTSSGDQMSFQIGIANLLIVFAVILLFIFKKVKKEKLYVLFFIAWFFFLQFLMNPLSTVLWEYVPGLSYFQFPWRLLSLVIFACSILAGSLAGQFKSKPILIGFALFAILSTYSYAHAPYFWSRVDSHYTSRSNFIYGTNSIGNGFQTKWLSQQKSVPLEKIEVVSKNGVVQKTKIRPNQQIYVVDMKSKGSLKFNTAYFPGWNIYIDGISVEAKNASGLMKANVGKGKHEISLKFEDTNLRRLATGITILSLLSVLILLGLPVLQWIYGNRNR